MILRRQPSHSFLPRPVLFRVSVLILLTLGATMALGTSSLLPTTTAHIATSRIQPLVPTSATPPRATARAAPSGQGSTNPDSLPLAFELNGGQSAPSVKFLAHASNAILFFTAEGVVFSVGQIPPDSHAGDNSVGPRLATSSLPANKAVRLTFLGANPSTRISGERPLPGKVSYLVGNDPSKWHRNLSTYSGLTYADLYPGIALSYSGAKGQLKSTYTIAPGVDPARLRWRYEGPEKVSVDPGGNLQLLFSAPAEGGSAIIDGPQVVLTEQAPVAWQEKAGVHVSVSARYSVSADGSVSFVLGAFDRTLPLIIDPVLTYSTYFGGSGNDFGSGVAYDSAGHLYLADTTSSTDLPVMNPAQPQLAGSSDAFVMKIDPASSTLLYATYLGGSAEDRGSTIAVDSAGEAFVAGPTSSVDFPVSRPFQPSFAGGTYDAFVTRLDSTGSSLVFSTFLGGRGDDDAIKIAVDADANIYVVGDTSSTDFPVQHALQPANRGHFDAFLSKFYPDGSDLVYSTYLGGGNDEGGYGLAVDQAGHAYVSGFTWSLDYPLHNPVQSQGDGYHGNAFLSKVTPDGSAFVYSTYLGGTSTDVGEGVTADSAGNAYLTGYTNSTNFPVVNALQQTFAGGAYDAFVSKFDPSGSSLIFSTYLGASQDDRAYAPAVDSSGNVFLAGMTNSYDYPVLNAVQSQYGGGPYDGFVSELNAQATALVYSTYLGGSGDDVVATLAVQPGPWEQSVYAAGSTNSGDFKTVHPYQPSNAGGYDAFLVQIARAFTTPVPTATGTPPTATATPTTTSTRTVTPTGTDTGTPTVTSTPTPCCTAVGATAISTCTLDQGGLISSQLTITNSCPWTVYVRGSRMMQLAETENGPWSNGANIPYGDIGVQPGAPYTIFDDWPAYVGQNSHWYRFRMEVTDANGCFSFNVYSEPAPICYNPPPTPQVTGTPPTATPTYTPVRDPDLQAGFPVQTFNGPGSFRQGVMINTLVGNIDASPDQEIVVSALADGTLYAWKSNGSLVQGWPVNGIPGVGYPSMGKLSRTLDGLQVFSGHYANAGWLVALSGLGAFLPGWPRTSANFVASPASLADVDGDGLDEAFVEEEDFAIHAYRGDGTGLPGWPQGGGSGQERDTPAIGDLNCDGSPEIVTASSHISDSGVCLYAYHADGSTVAGFPLCQLNDQMAHSFPAIGDVNGDGQREIVLPATDQAGSIVELISPSGVIERTLRGAVAQDTAPALADMNGDGIPEIVVTGGNSITVWQGNGTVLPGWPVTWPYGSTANSAPVVGDVDGDGQPDIVITNQLSQNWGEVRAYSHNGTLLPHFPKTLRLGRGAVPAIADIDGDGRNEIIVTADYWNGTAGDFDKVWVYDLRGTGQYGPVLWGQFGGGPRHQSFYGSSLPCSTATPAPATPTATFSPTPSASPTGIHSATPNITWTPTGTPTEIPTGTVISTPATPAATATGTFTPGPEPTYTATTATTTTATATVSATPCTVSFVDVSPSDYFYVPVQYLYCHGAISGYSDGTFRPYNNSTRGQLSKIIVLAESWPVDTSGGPHFSDVSVTQPFYPYIETAYNRQIISGYADGTFRPGNNVTRGQTCKIVVLAQGWPVTAPPVPSFTDVPPSSPFYGYVETAYGRGVISGYADSTFRPGNDVTRGQLCKIVYNALTLPTPTPTSTLTVVPTATPTSTDTPTAMPSATTTDTPTVTETVVPATATGTPTETSPATPGPR